MTTIEPAADESTDLEPRDARALTEYMTVLDDVDDGNGDHVGDRPDDCECWDGDANLPNWAIPQAS